MSDFRWPVRVYYEDTDAGGVVYYANYLRFMERARTEWLRHCGLEQDWLRAEHGLIFVVAAVDVRYRRPARYNDRLEVSVEIDRQMNASIHFRQEVFRVAEPQVALCSALTRAGCVDAQTLRPRRLPPAVQEMLRR